MSEDLASQWKRRNKMLQERSAQNNINKNTQQNQKSFDYQIIETKPDATKTKPFKQNSNRKAQNLKQMQVSGIEPIQNSPQRPQQKVNQKQNQQIIYPENSSSSQSSQISQRQSSSASKQNSKTASRQQSPILTRVKSPEIPTFARGRKNRSNCNRNYVLICILFILSIVCLAGFVYTDTERFCDYNNGEEGVSGCKKCPQYSENCSFYFFDCDPYFYNKYDGYCVPTDYYEEFRDLRDDLHVHKTISLSTFIENRGNQAYRNSDKVLNAVRLCRDVILDNDDIKLIEMKRDFSLIYIALGLLTSIIVFTIVNFAN